MLPGESCDCLGVGLGQMQPVSQYVSMVAPEWGREIFKDIGDFPRNPDPVAAPPGAGPAA
jgi:hypothetical protein